MRAVNNGSSGDVVVLGPGTYTLSASQRLIPKDHMTIRRAGINRTTIKPAHTWDPGETGLPNEINANKAVREAFLFTLENTKAVTLPDDIIRVAP